MAVLITFLSLSCVNAQDLNASDADVSLDDSAQPVELSLDDTLEVASDDEALLAGSENQQQTTPEVISTNSKSSSYLILDNDADNENVHIGDVVVWTVSVINLGPDMAKNVKVIDKLPSGLKYIKHIASIGTFNPKTGIWDIGDLAVEDGKVYLDIFTKAISLGEQINKVHLITDSINLNPIDYEEEEIDVEEEDSDEDDEFVAVKTIHSTGNPIFLVLMSLLVIVPAIFFKK